MKTSGGARWWACAAVVCVLGVGVALPPASDEASGRTTSRVQLFRFVDRSRTIRLPDGRRVPRTLDTTVRYPATGGSYPLIVFAHGFALTPVTYQALLSAWARAGYVVAAPWFPLEKANAPTALRSSTSLTNPEGDQLRHLAATRAEWPDWEACSRAGSTRRRSRSLATPTAAWRHWPSRTAATFETVGCAPRS